MIKKGQIHRRDLTPEEYLSKKKKITIREYREIKDKKLSNFTVGKLFNLLPVLKELCLYKMTKAEAREILIRDIIEGYIEHNQLASLVEIYDEVNKKFKMTIKQTKYLLLLSIWIHAISNLGSFIRSISIVLYSSV